MIRAGAPDPARRAVIENVYKKVNGTLDGLDDKIGPAYSVWIPWDAAGGPRQDLSLICRFIPKVSWLIRFPMAFVLGWASAGAALASLTHSSGSFSPCSMPVASRNGGG